MGRPNPAAAHLHALGAASGRLAFSAPAADRLRAHQARGEERPSALPPVLLAVHLAVARRPAREARQLQHVLLPPARLRRGARRLGGAAAAPLLFAGPPSSMARLSRFKQKLAGECCWSTPLPQASCAAGELICRRAGRGASSGPEKLRPEEAADGREPKAGGEGEEDQGSRRGRGCGAGMRCYQQVNNVWGVYNTSCPPGAPPELPSSTRQSLPAIIDCLCSEASMDFPLRPRFSRLICSYPCSIGWVVGTTLASCFSYC